MLPLLIFIPLALILVAFQSAVLNQITLAGGHLDIIILSLVLFTLYGSYELALLAAVAIAPIMDAVSGLPLGVSVIPLLTVVTLAHLGSKTIFGARLGWPILVIFLGVLLAALLTMLELILLGWELPWYDLLLRVVVPSAFLNALAALVIYLPIVLFSEHQETRLP